MNFAESASACAAKVRLVIFDVDGVLTDGGVYMGEKGELYKPFFVRDGLAIALLHRVGIKTAIITGRESAITSARVRELKIDIVRQGCLDKRVAYHEIKAQLQLQDEAIAYIGDDLVDLPIMAQVGFPAAVGDAVAEVRSAAVFVSDLPGGHGAVRDILEYILKEQGLWNKLVASFTATAPLSGLVQ